MPMVEEVERHGPFVWCATLVVAASVGCSSEPVLIADLPEETAWFAVVFEGTEPAESFATGLLRYRPHEANRIEVVGEIPAEARTWVVGYSAAQIDAVGAPDEEMAREEPLTLAAESDPVLPPALWVGRGVFANDLVAVAQTTDSLELTASWLPECPTVLFPERRNAVEIGCSPVYCGAIAEQLGCRVVVTARSCALSGLELNLDGRGQLRGGRLGDDPCMAVPANDALVSTRCGVCDVRIFQEPFPERFTTQHLTVVEGVPVVGNLDTPFTGYLNDFAAVGDRVAVVSQDGRSAVAACNSPLPTRTYFYDLADASFIGSATTPPCLEAILADPGGSSFVGLFDQGRGIARFDQEGRLVASATVGIPLGTFKVVDLVDGTSRHLAAAMTEVGANASVFVVFNRADLTTVSITPVSSQVLSVTSLPNDVVLLGNDVRNELWTMDGATGAHIGTSRIIAGDLAKNADFVAQLPVRDELLVASLGVGSSLHHLRGAENSGTWTTYEVPDQIASPIVWPHAPDTVLVNVFERRGRSSIALVDVGEHRFLPGAHDIGAGPASQAFRDPAERIWLLLPWTGEVVIVDARR